MKTIILNTDSLLNPGDAAIVLAQVLLLRKLRPGCAVALTSRTPDLDRSFFGPLGVEVHPALLPAPSLWRGAWPKLAGSLTHALQARDKLRLIRAIRAADFVVSCGGGPFYSNRRSLPGLTFRQNVLHVRLAQALGKPVLFFPQSFGPFASPAARRAVGRLLGHPGTAAILVRESLSLGAVSRLAPAAARARIEPCPDLAFWLSPPAEPGSIGLPPLRRPWLFLTVRDWDFPEARSAAEREGMRRRYLESVRAAARRFSLERAGSVIIIPHTRGPGDFEDDRIVSRRLHTLLRADIPAGRLALPDLPDKASPADLMALYARADLLLATRTHAAIFGLLSGRPVASIHYQPKGLGIMASVGLADRSLPIAAVDADSLGRALDAAAAQTAAEAGRIAERIEGLRSEIEIRIGRAVAAAEGRP